MNDGVPDGEAEATRMTTAREIRQLAAPLRQRNPDLALVGPDTLRLLPLGHVGRQVPFQRRRFAESFFLSWHISEPYLPTARPTVSFGRCDFSIYRPDSPSGQRFGTWEWADPGMSADFMMRMESEVLPLLRPLDTLARALAFVRGHTVTEDRRGTHWHLVTAIALGELDVARALRRTIEAEMVPGRVQGHPLWQRSYDRHCEIGAPLMADDRAALAALLHRWEAENVRGTKIEPYWKPTPFPLEEG